MKIELTEESLMMALRGAIVLAREHQAEDVERIIRMQIMSLVGGNRMKVIHED
jgi:hypothetical protein